MHVLYYFLCRQVFTAWYLVFGMEKFKQDVFFTSKTARWSTTDLDTPLKFALKGRSHYAFHSIDFHSYSYECWRETQAHVQMFHRFG